MDRSRRRKSSARGFYTPFEGLDQHFASFPAHPHRSPKACGDHGRVEGWEEAHKLFLEAVKGVVPLDSGGRKRVPPAAPVKSPPRFRPQEENLVVLSLKDLVTGNGAFELTYSDEYVDGAIAGLSPDVLKRLRLGEFSTQDYVDLHGCTRDQARAKVNGFVHRCFASGRRCILIVSGRGLNSKDKQPVLKENLVRWLTRSPLKRLVLAFASARSCDGGAGAFYVLLRRKEGKTPVVSPAV